MMALVKLNLTMTFVMQLRMWLSDKLLCPCRRTDVQRVAALRTQLMYQLDAA
jgi:hypothetical protein